MTRLRWFSLTPACPTSGLAASLPRRVQVMLNHRQDIAEIEERRVEQAELVKNKYGSGGAAAAEGADDAAKTEEAAA